MRIRLLFLSLLSFASYSFAQDYTFYEKPVKLTLFSEALKDSVELEITLPKDLNRQTNATYPIIYLLDRQLNINYNYNLHTIDYLSTLESMPMAIVVGITFSRNSRQSWTIPNASGGKADDLISFIADELNEKLKDNYLISEFNLLIGHSRTAIFASYALSKRFDFFNGAIANSVADFDFGDTLQKAQFETFIDAIDTKENKYFYYFSVGENAYGDLHESAVDTLNAFLNAKDLPKNFEWKYYKHKAPHDLTPGLTVAKSLSEIFKAYGRRVDQSFKIAQNSPDKVPWDEYQALYNSLSTDFGYTIQPAELFFNSIGSEYYFDQTFYGEDHLRFSLEILLEAIETYPNDYGYLTWIGEIYITLKDYKEADRYLNQSIQFIEEDKDLSETDRADLLNEIKALTKLME